MARTYQDIVQSLHPLAYYPLNDNPAVGFPFAFLDFGPNGYHATGGGAFQFHITPGPDAGNRTARFLNGYAILPAGFRAALTINSFTFSAWATAETFLANDVLGDIRIDANNEWFAYRVFANKSYRGSLLGAGVLQEAQFVLNTNDWVHVAVTSNAGVAKLYINGILRATSAATTPLAGAITAATIAASFSGINIFQGSMAHVAYYNKILSDSDINLLSQIPVVQPSNTFVDPVGELHTLATADGKSMVFAPEDKEVQFIVYGNYGAPPTNYITRRGYRQDGETELYYTLGPRALSIELHRSPGCTRQQYWENRNDFHNILRPNRNGPMILTLRRQGNIKRSIVVRADPGLILPPPSVDENNWDITETISFMAFNPIWYDPASISVAPSGSIDSNLIFPITFPIKFGVNQQLYESIIVYAGTWRAYPTITLTGPFTAAIINNVTTGAQIFMAGSVAAGDQRIITLTPGAQSILDATGVSKFGELGVSSNLVDFNLRPDPEVAGGINDIQCLFANATLGQTAFQLSYNNQYFAI